MIPLDQVEPNPWNPNQMNETEYQAARQSIRLHGFVAPVIVWAKRTKGKTYLIIDGEHRCRAARDEGMLSVSAVILQELTVTQAKRLTLSLNLHGSPDQIALANLLASLKPELGKDLGVGLPYTAQQLQQILAMAGATLPTYDSEKPAEKTQWVQLQFVVAPGVAKVVERALAHAMEEGETEDRGRGLELVCADYLAGVKS